VTGKAPRVAIVHDWLVGGGAERVVQALHELYPDAPIYTSYCTAEWRQRLDGAVVTGFLQRWPFSKLRKFVPVLRIWWFTHLDLSEYDLVISSSGNGEALGVKTPEHTLHINYCHSPTHFYWRHYDQYLAQPGFGMLNPLVRLGLRVLVGPLRKWDYRAAQRADYHIANSSHIQADIKTYYGRESTVIHPPIDIERFAVPEPKQRRGFVIAGRQVPQKKFDLAVQACTKLNMPLAVLGKGPEHEHLKTIAGPSVTFVKEVSDQEMPLLIAQGEAFIFPSFEDFGVIAVEAQAAGTPVIAYKAGGALDYVQDGVTGTFFDEQTAESLAHTLQRFKAADYKADVIRRHAAQFSVEHFKHTMRSFVDTALADRPSSKP
jgi:glycosyltransferase involved in cell wall biosynthesis